MAWFIALMIWRELLDIQFLTEWASRALTFKWTCESPPEPAPRRAAVGRVRQHRAEGAGLGRRHDHFVAVDHGDLILVDLPGADVEGGERQDRALVAAAARHGGRTNEGRHEGRHARRRLPGVNRDRLDRIGDDLGDAARRLAARYALARRGPGQRGGRLLAFGRSATGQLARSS